MNLTNQIKLELFANASVVFCKIYYIIQSILQGTNMISPNESIFFKESAFSDTMRNAAAQPISDSPIKVGS